MLAGRHIVLGVSGGVAAYKAAYLARRLVEAGALVKVVMTESSQQFIGASTFAALTGEHPVTGLFNSEEVSPHTSMAKWADAIVIAPATAATLAKLAHGESSNALVATTLASTCPIVVAPAMHTEMWDHTTTQQNVASLRAIGYRTVGPESGELAGGDVGMGRMSEPDDILDAVTSLFEPGSLDGVRVLISAGGTRETIDPVRYIGNRSSGKMGGALAEAALKLGAIVTMVTTAPTPADPRITTVCVETADEMAEAVWRLSVGQDVAIMAAAVADFRPTQTSSDKIRRAAGTPELTLEATPDVLAGLTEKGDVPIIVGFAAEAGSIDEAYAKAKRKKVDLLVANDIAKAGSGFGSDTNEVTLIYRDGTSSALPLMSKRDVADAVLAAIVALRA